VGFEYRSIQNNRWATTILTLFLGGTLVLFAIAVFTSGSWDASLLLPFLPKAVEGLTVFSMPCLWQWLPMGPLLHFPSW
jgi:hypothetical protein